MAEATEDDIPIVDDGPGQAVAAQPAWRMLIVDDEPDMHAVTEAITQKLTFRARRVVAASAFSAAEAREILSKSTEGFSLILLDVVMETDHAGLELVRWLREDRLDSKTRIILRTGQPGVAPEWEVIRDYEIDDYKAKTELTSIRLQTCVVAALRAWSTLDELDRARKDLERLIEVELLDLFSFGICLFRDGKIFASNRQARQMAEARSVEPASLLRRLVGAVGRLQLADRPELMWSRRSIEIGGTITEIVVLIEPNQMFDLPAGFLSDRFELTFAESRLVNDLLTRGSVQEIAAWRGMSEQTLRTQLKSIFRKTQTSRQSELIAEVLKTAVRVTLE